jgi:hypothetical protein
VSRRTSAGLERTVGTVRWTGIENPVVANAAEHLGPPTGQVVSDGDWVIAGIEDEQRDGTSHRQKANEVLHLVDGGRGGIHLWADPHQIHRGRPTVESPVQLADPLIGPPSHDGLAGRVLGGRVVEAPIGTALGVTPVPGLVFVGAIAIAAIVVAANS